MVRAGLLYVLADLEDWPQGDDKDRYMHMLDRVYKLSHELMWVEVPLLLAEGRVRYGFGWADLARITDTDMTPQALHKRHASRVATIIRVAKAWDPCGDSEDFYDECGFYG
jgi:hypothetical protein